MSEQLGHSPEIQTTDQEQNIVLKGLTRVVGQWREWRLNQLEESVTKLQHTVEDVDESMKVNQVTGQYARIERGVGAVVKDKDFNNPETSQAEKDAWKIKTSHTSATEKEAPDGTKVTPLRPVTREEINVKRSVETAEARAVRPSGSISDLHRIYDRVDTETAKQQAPIPDRRRERGNEKARALVDESLRRRNLLKDQTARGPTPKIRIGTEEHTEVMKRERLTGKQKKGLRKAEKVLGSQQNAVSNQVEYVKSVADGTDQSAKRSQRRIEYTQSRIDRKQKKIIKLRSKTT